MFPSVLIVSSWRRRNVMVSQPCSVCVIMILWFCILPTENEMNKTTLLKSETNNFAVNSDSDSSKQISLKLDPKDLTIPHTKNEDTRWVRKGSNNSLVHRHHFCWNTNVNMEEAEHEYLLNRRGPERLYRPIWIHMGLDESCTHVFPYAWGVISICPRLKPVQRNKTFHGKTNWPLNKGKPSVRVYVLVALAEITTWQITCSFTNLSWCYITTFLY